MHEMNMESDTSTLIEQRTVALLQHPYQRFCGLELMSQDASGAVCRMEVGPNVTNLSNTLHGGVIYSMADVASMCATLVHLGEYEYVVSHSMNASLMAAVPESAALRLEARVVKRGRSLVFTSCEAYGESGGQSKHVATINITKSILRDSKFATLGKKETTRVA